MTSPSYPIARLFATVFVGGFLSAAPAETSWQAEWTADNLPQDSHPRWHYFGGGEVTAVDDGIRVVSDTETSTAGFRLVADEQIWNPREAGEVEMEISLRVILQEGDFATLVNLWGFGPNGDKCWSIKFRATGIQINTGPITAYDMENLHTFRIRATAERLEIFADGDEPLAFSEIPQDSLNDPGAAGLNTIDFGDTSGTGGGTAEWQFVRWRTR